MRQTKTRQSFTVVIKSSRRTTAEEKPSSLWKDVDLAAAQRLVNRQMEDYAFPAQPHDNPSGLGE